MSCGQRLLCCVRGIVWGMKMYRFRTDAKDQIDRAGVTQATIARGAAYDRHVLNRKISRQANVRPATANRIARAFGTVTGIGRMRRLPRSSRRSTSRAEVQRIPLDDDDQAERSDQV
jgi:hypothetical protein